MCTEIVTKLLSCLWGITEQQFWTAVIKLIQSFPKIEHLYARFTIYHSLIFLYPYQPFENGLTGAKQEFRMNESIKLSCDVDNDNDDSLPRCTCKVNEQTNQRMADWLAG